MLDTVGNTIKMTRGDTAYLKVTLENVNVDSDGKKTYTPYSIKSTDKLTLAIAPLNATDDSETLVRKEVTGTNTIGLIPADTENLKADKYMYNVKLHTSSGDKFTVVKASHLILDKEVD